MVETRETKEKLVLTSVKFAQEFAGFFDPARSLQLVGFCVLYRLAGYPSPKSLRNEGRTFFGLGKSAIYRCFVDLRRFRLHLVELGYHRVGLTDDASNTYEQGIEDLRQVVDREMVDAVATVVPVIGQGSERAASV